MLAKFVFEAPDYYKSAHEVTIDIIKPVCLINASL